MTPHDPPVRRILVVDDEPNIVHAVQRELRTPPLGHYRYEVETFTDPRAALERARSQSFDAVVSDYRMPDLDGIAFLKELGHLQPDCARLVLSGQTDLEGLARMINETHIYRFIAKPWHDYYLKGSVAQALDHAAAMAETRRLAGLIREHGIVVPEPESSVDQLIIVDDDAGVLNSLARLLTRHSPIDDLFQAIRSELDAAGSRARLDESKLSVQVTPSPRHALEMAGAVGFSCIIADQRIQEMSGVELLQRFADLQPDCQRILISGHAVEADLIDAIGAANIFAFIAKPWSDYEVKATVAQALTQRRVQRENRLLAEMVRSARRLAD